MAAFVQRYTHASLVFQRIIKALEAGLEMEVKVASAKIAGRR